MTNIATLCFPNEELSLTLNSPAGGGEMQDQLHRTLLLLRHPPTHGGHHDHLHADDRHQH